MQFENRIYVVFENRVNWLSGIDQEHAIQAFSRDESVGCVWRAARDNIHANCPVRSVSLLRTKMMRP